MKDYKIISNKGYYIGKQNKNIYNSAMKLIENEVALFGIDNSVYLYYKDGEKIKRDFLNPQKDYMKVSAKFDFPAFADTLFKQYNIYNSMELYTQEQEIWIDHYYHLDLFLLPFQVRIQNEDILIYPSFKIYSNNIVIISFAINSDDDIDSNLFEKLFVDINRETFERMSIPINYAPNGIEYDKEECIMDEEKGEYVELETTWDFSNIIYFSKYLLRLFENVEETGIFYGKCAYLLEENEKELTSDFLDTLLKGAKGRYIHELKDYSINKDFKKYCNERATILVSKNVLKQESLIQTIEEMMIVNTIMDTILYSGIKKNEYKYKELKHIYMNMLYSEFDGRVSHYGEIEDFLKTQHSFMNRENKLSYLKSCFDAKIKDKEAFYQEKIALFALLLSASPLVDYILFPLMSNVLHIEIFYKFVLQLKESFIGRFINLDGLNILCFILAIFMIYTFYKIKIKRIM